MTITEDTRIRVSRVAAVIGEGYEIVEVLRDLSQGASFSQILERTGLNPKILTRKLWVLMEENIIERFVVVPDEKRKYSCYKLTPEGTLFIEKLVELNMLE